MFQIDTNMTLNSAELLRKQSDKTGKKLSKLDGSIATLKRIRGLEGQTQALARVRQKIENEKNQLSQFSDTLGTITYRYSQANENAEGLFDNVALRRTKIKVIALSVPIYENNIIKMR